MLLLISPFLNNYFLLQGVTFLNQKIILEPLSALLPIRDIPKDSFLHEFSAAENFKPTLGIPKSENVSSAKLEMESIGKNEDEYASIKSDEWILIYIYRETANKREWAHLTNLNFL